MGTLEERAQKEAQGHRKELRKHINKLLDDVENAKSITEYEGQAARLCHNVIMFIRSHEFRIRQNDK